MRIILRTWYTFDILKIYKEITLIRSGALFHCELWIYLVDAPSLHGKLFADSVQILVTYISEKSKLFMKKEE